MAKKDTVVKFRNPINFNIGVVIFVIIIIYVLFNVFSYFTKNEIAKYQVQQGQIASNYIYQGIILRDETVEYAAQEGYVDYFMKNCSKVSVTDVIYSIDKVGNISKSIAQVATGADNLSSGMVNSIAKKIDNFLKNYDLNQFETNYSFLSSLNSEIVYDINTGALEALADKINHAQANNTFFQYTSSDDGVIVYKTDGMDGITAEQLILNGIDTSQYKENYLSSNRQVKTSDAVYKRINSEEWSVLVPIDHSLSEKLANKRAVNIRFCKDNYVTNASCQIHKKDDAVYLELSLNTGMVRYAEDRFVDIEILMGSTSGLKIPVSAITSKEFFTIPKEYFTVDSDYLMLKTVEDGVESVKRIQPTIYFASESHYYVDNELLKAGDIILMPDSQSTYVIGTDTDSLIGVYNVNKGYAVFKQINILYQNKEYAIIETKTAYGISLYDHIALDASSVTENQLITK